MPENPLNIIEKLDPDFFENIEKTRELSLEDWAYLVNTSSSLQWH